MAGRSVDVSLRVKAQDEASNALAAITKALGALATAQRDVSSGSSNTGRSLEEAFKSIAGLEGPLKAVEGITERLNASLAAQGAALAKATASIDARKAKLEELRATEARYQAQLAKGFVGPVEQGVNRNALRNVQRQIVSQTGGIDKDTAAQQRYLESIRLSREEVLRLRDAEFQLRSSLSQTVTQWDQIKTAADAAARATTEARVAASTESVQARINRTTGVGANGTLPSLRNQRQADLEAAFAPVFRAEDAKAQEAAFKAAADAHKAFEDRVKQGVVEMNREAAAFAELQKYARDVAEALDPAAKTARLLAEEESRLGAAVKAGALSRDQANAALAKYKSSLDGSAAAAERESAETKQLATFVQELRRQYDPAAYAAEFLRRKTDELNKAQKAGLLSAGEYQKALAAIRKESENLGERSNIKLFGLAPYQTQNLLFQFNDIATQLASGTSLTQTLAQQGGQILQLFPRVGNAIAGAFTVGNAAAIGLAAAIGIIIARGLELQAQTRVLTATLAANADGANYSAAGLIEAARSMREFGINTQDAMKIVDIAVKRGFGQESINAFGKSAKGLAVILGVEVVDAANQLADALKGGYDGIAALDDKTNILTATQREQIRALFEQGNATDAVRLATDLLGQKLGETADKAESDWSKAINNLAAAWNRLLDALANTGAVQAAINGLAKIANIAAATVDYLDGVNSTAEKQARLQEIVLREFGGLRNRANATPNGYVAKPGYENDGTTKFQIQEANRLQAEISAEQRRNNDALLQAQQRATEQATERVKKADDEVKRAQERLATEKKITSEADVRAAVAAKRADLQVQAQKQFPNASDAVRNGFVEAQIVQYRTGLEKQLSDFNKQAAAELERTMREQRTYQFQAAQLLRGFEGRGGKFTPRAYYDVNAYRIGFGSDTITDPTTGTYRSVRKGDTTTVAAAEADLARRIEEFANVVKTQITPERFGAFSAQQQAALISIAYNYGSLPQRIIGAVRSGTNEEIAKAVRGLAGDNNSINARRRNQEAAILGVENGAVTANAQKQADALLAKQKEYNADLDAQLAAEERSIANQRELIGLHGEDLRNAIERQQVAEAIAKATERLRDRLNDPDAKLSPEQRNRITVDVKARLKLDEPAKVAADLQKQVDDLQNFRGALETKIQEKRSRGDIGGAREVQQQIDEIDAKIAQAAKSYLDFLNTPGNADALGLYGASLDAVIAKMTTLSEKTAEWRLRIGTATISANEFANAFTNSATNALDGFAQAVANGANVFRSLGDAFRQFAADFLLQIAKMIQQQIIFNLVSGLLRSIGGGIGGVGTSVNGFGAVGGIQAHGGGVIGMASTYGAGTGFRSVSPALFAAAMRYHSGGIAGLKPGEVPSILMRGEEVLTRDDPRHVLNGGGGGTGSVKIVNAFDHGDVISKALETKAGEKAVLNLVRSNPRAFRAAMGN